VVQDHNGLIWASGDRGVNSFDGRHFKSYGYEEGLTHNLIVEMCVDSTGMLWVVSNDGLLFYFEDDRFHAYDTDYNALFGLIGSRDIIQLIVDEQIKIVTDRGIVLIDDHQIDESYLNQELGLVFAPDFHPRAYFSLINPGNTEMTWASSDSQRVYYSDRENVFYKRPKWNGKMLLKRSSFLTGDLLFDRGLLFRIEEDTLRLETVLLKNFTDGIAHWGRFFAGGINTGLHVLDRDFRTIGQYFSQFSISKFLVDRQGGLWISTLRNGLLHIPSLEVRVLDASPSFVDVTTFGLIDSSRFYFANFSGEFWMYDLDRRSGTKILQLEYPFLDIVKINQSDYILGGLKLVKIRGKTVLDSYAHFCRRVFQFGSDASLIWTSLSRTLVGFSQDDGFEPTHRIPLPSDLYASLVHRNELFLGLEQGLYLVTEDKDVQRCDAFPAIDLPVRRFDFLSNQEIIFASHHGLFYAHQERDSLVNVSEALDIPHSFHQIKVDQGLVWLASDKQGLYVLDSTLQQIVGYMGLGDGIPSRKINRIYIEGETLILCTKKGIVFLPISAVLNKRSISSLQVSYEVNGRRQGKAPSDLSFSHRDVRPALHISHVNLVRNDFTRVEHRINDGEWRGLDAEKMPLADFGFGEHRFAFRAFDDRNQVVAQQTITTNIRPPFEQSKWFIALVSMLGTGLVFLFSWKRWQQQKKREIDKINLELRVKQLKDEVLRSKLNPHFLFNSLNSLQRLFLEDKHTEAGDYLSDISLFFRLVLEYSSQSTISVRKEWEVAELYLNLEKMRLKEHLNFEVMVDLAEEKMDCQVPSLLTQPIIENAIWHGIMPLRDQQNGKIIVRIREDHPFVVFEVEDNGVGYVSTSDHLHSFGERITKDRLRDKDSFHIESRPEFEGTKVQIKIDQTV
ncbi:MAG: histidine kinase, partial [Bacteroidota bacterium]